MMSHRAVRARSWLFTPGTRPDRFFKGTNVGADIAILDLEDSVAPQDKHQARSNVLAFLSAHPEGGLPYALRINPIDTPAGITDLNALLASSAAPEFLLLPKTESPDHLRDLDRRLASVSRSSRLVAQIESARGLVAVETIATATPRLAGIVFGAADMAADLGCDISWEALAFVRSRIVVACALGGVQAIDTPFFRMDDESGLRQEAAAAAALGFSAKAAIHPNQVEAINQVFSPTPEDIEKARSVLSENSKGVGTVDGLMVDEAMARRARRTLAAAGLLD